MLPSKVEALPALDIHTRLDDRYRVESQAPAAVAHVEGGTKFRTAVDRRLQAVGGSLLDVRRRRELPEHPNVCQLELVIRHFGEGVDIDIVADSLKAFDVRDVAEDRNMDELFEGVHSLLVALRLEALE